LRLKWPVLEERRRQAKLIILYKVAFKWSILEERRRQARLILLYKVAAEMAHTRGEKKAS